MVACAEECIARLAVVGLFLRASCCFEDESMLFTFVLEVFLMEDVLFKSPDRGRAGDDILAIRRLLLWWRIRCCEMVQALSGIRVEVGLKDLECQE